MQNMKRRTTFLVVFSLIMLVLAFNRVVAQEDHAGLGISHYDLDAPLIVDTPSKFAVARIYNTGNVDLNIAAVWIPNGDAQGLNVTPISPMFLSSGESTKVHVNVYASKTGNYSGVVEFETSIVSNVTGSLVLPGGTVQCSFSVIEVPIETDEDIIEDDDSTDSIPDDDSTQNPTPTQNDEQPEAPPQEDTHNKTQKLDVGTGLILIVTLLLLQCSVPILLSWYDRRGEQK